MSMTCDEVRGRIDERYDPAVAAHLQLCPACRAEAELSDRLAAAMKTMPYAPAPPELADAVMAELLSSPQIARPPRRTPPLVLRPTEAAGLGLVCMIMILAGWSLFAPWIASAGSFIASWIPVPPLPRTIPAVMPALRSGIERVARLLSEPASALPGAPIAWLWGSLAFTVGFFLFVTWRAESDRRPATEESHA